MPVPDLSILELFRCPVTHSKLSIMSPEQLAAVNQTIGDGKASDRKGRAISDQLEAGLINADKSFAYSILAEIMQLIADEAIVLDDTI